MSKENKGTGETRNSPVPNSQPDMAGAPLAAEHFHGVAPATNVKPEALVADEYVLMVFPKPVRIYLPNHASVAFPAGINKVPAELADHWYFEKNGVKRHK